MVRCHLCIVWINLCLPDNNHVDDEEEAVDFINNHVKNSTAFIMNVDEEDLEQDCSAVQNSNSMHEFRYM